MSIRSITFFFTVLLIQSCSSEKRSSSNHSSVAYHRELLKQYAYCRCVVSALPQDSAMQNDISLSVLSDISEYDLTKFSIIDTIATAHALTITKTEIGDYGERRPVLASCMQFYKSKYLDSVVRTLDKAIVKVEIR